MLESEKKALMHATVNFLGVTIYVLLPLFNRLLGFRLQLTDIVDLV